MNDNVNEYGINDYLLNYQYKNQHKVFKNIKKSISSNYENYENDAKNRVLNKNDLEDKFEQYNTDWQVANIDECIQETLLKFRNEVFLFYKTDNIDESQMFKYLKKLSDLVSQLFKHGLQRSIYDVSTVVDTLFYLVYTQVS